MKKLFLFIFVVLNFNYSFANHRDNGGDPCEQKFLAIRDDISNWIEKGGPAGLNFFGKTDLETYNLTVKNAIELGQVSCVDSDILVGNAVKTCKNFIDSDGVNRIHCNRNRFLEHKASDQYVLVHHEYLGIAGLETNTSDTSSYYLSNQISAFVEEVLDYRLAINPNRVFRNIVLDSVMLADYQYETFLPETCKVSGPFKTYSNTQQEYKFRCNYKYNIYLITKDDKKIVYPGKEGNEFVLTCYNKPVGQQLSCKATNEELQRVGIKKSADIIPFLSWIQKDKLDVLVYGIIKMGQEINPRGQEGKCYKSAVKLNVNESGVSNRFDLFYQMTACP